MLSHSVCFALSPSACLAFAVLRVASTLGLILVAHGTMSAVEATSLQPPPILVPDSLPATNQSADEALITESGVLPAPSIGSSPDSRTNGTFELTIGSDGSRDSLSNAVRLLLMITVLSVAPGFLMMMTSFTRIIIVLGFVRRAIGTQTLPPNQVLLGLSLFLTFFIMAPTFQELQQEVVTPYFAESINDGEALDRAESIMKQFMARHTRSADLALFVRISGDERPQTIDDVSFWTLVPAFITSELKTAFQMGFIIFLPFVIIDVVISGVLMALGMMMLPPVMISLPFKILLFVLVDGWVLLIQSLVASYR